MRRIGRWMLNALTVLSLLLCVGTCVLWVRSYTVEIRVIHDHGPQSGRDFSVESAVGWLCIEDSQRLQSKPRARWEYEVLGHEARFIWASYFDRVPPVAPGVLWDKNTRGRGSWTLAIHWGWLFSLLAVAPAIRSVRLIRRRRRSRGLCACGYHLEGNVSGVCPECGMKIAEAK